MSNRSPGTGGEVTRRRCIVYDVDEKDPAKKKIDEFESMTACAEFLGIKNGHVCQIIKFKWRHKNKKLGKTITIR